MRRSKRSLPCAGATETLPGGRSLTCSRPRARGPQSRREITGDPPKMGGVSRRDRRLRPRFDRNPQARVASEPPASIQQESALGGTTVSSLRRRPSQPRSTTRGRSTGWAGEGGEGRTRRDASQCSSPEVLERFSTTSHLSSFRSSSASCLSRATATPNSCTTRCRGCRCRRRFESGCARPVRARPPARKASPSRTRNARRRPAPRRRCVRDASLRAARARPRSARWLGSRMTRSRIAAALLLAFAGCHKPVADSDRSPPSGNEAPPPLSPADSADASAALLRRARCVLGPGILQGAGTREDIEVGDAVAYEGGYAVGFVHRTAANRARPSVVLVDAAGSRGRGESQTWVPR